MSTELSVTQWEELNQTMYMELHELDALPSEQRDALLYCHSMQMHDIYRRVADIIPSVAEFYHRIMSTLEPKIGSRLASSAVGPYTIDVIGGRFVEDTPPDYTGLAQEFAEQTTTNSPQTVASLANRLVRYLLGKVSSEVAAMIHARYSIRALSLSSVMNEIDGVLHGFEAGIRQQVWERLLLAGQRELASLQRQPLT